MYLRDVRVKQKFVPASVCAIVTQIPHRAPSGVSINHDTYQSRRDRKPKRYASRESNRQIQIAARRRFRRG